MCGQTVRGAKDEARQHGSWNVRTKLAVSLSFLDRLSEIGLQPPEPFLHRATQVAHTIGDGVGSEVGDKRHHSRRGRRAFAPQEQTPRHGFVSPTPYRRPKTGL